MKNFLQKLSLPLWVVIAIMAIGYIAGLFVELPDNDSANHASISVAMLENGSWTTLLNRWMPYLDKPHFQFWIVTATFYLIGITTFAYKISSFIFTLLGLWATYKLTLHLCSRQSAIYATLITASMAAFALANVDVRMEAIVTGAIMLAVWMGVMFVDRQKWGWATGTALALAIAFGTKGWVGVFTPAIAIFCYVTYKQQFAWFFKWRAWVLIALFALFISPILYASYQQFDLHPELVIRGATGHSGIKFMLWDHAFGRMEGEWGMTSANDYFFYLHTLLWSALPWSFLFYFLFFKDVTAIARRREKINAIAALTIPAIVLTILIFSLSKFKLPHYITIIFPLMAMFMADSLVRLKSEKTIRGLNIMQKIILFIVIIFAALVNLYLFAIPNTILYVLTAAICLASALFLIYDNRSIKAMVYTGALFSGLLWIALNTNFYPQVGSYQAGAQIARVAKENNISPQNIGIYEANDGSFSLDVYLGHVPQIWSAEQVERRMSEGKATYLYLTQNFMDSLTANNTPMEVICSIPDYHITRLKPKFLNPKTRETMLARAYLVRLL